MSSSRNGLIGLGIGLGVAGAATAAGIVADRTHRRRQQALETGVSLVEKPSREVVVEATDGVALHVEVDEPRSGAALDEHGLPRPTVVMSHGYCLTSECWVFQRRYLRWAGHRVVVWDQRGHGRSGRGGSSSYTIGQLGQDLDSVIGGRPRGASGTCRPLDGRDDDDGARRLAPRARPRAGGRLRGDLDVGRGMPLASGGLAASAGRLLLERLGPGVASIFEHRPELLKGILSANSGRGVPRGAVLVLLAGAAQRRQARLEDAARDEPPVMSSFTPAFDDYDQTGGLAAFDGCETLVFNGEQDILTPPEHSERIVRTLAGAQHVIVRDAGHVIMLEHPDLLNQQLGAMIERAAKREEEQIPADLVPRVRRVVTDVDKRRRIERGLERIDQDKDDDQRRTRQERKEREDRTGTRREAS